jgi:hypothetical protein
MECKLCHLRETNNTSGICWRCLLKYHIFRNDYHLSETSHPENFAKNEKETFTN